MDRKQVEIMSAFADAKLKSEGMDIIAPDELMLKMEQDLVKDKSLINAWCDVKIAVNELNRQEIVKVIRLLACCYLNPIMVKNTVNAKLLEDTKIKLEWLCDHKEYCEPEEFDMAKVISDITKRLGMPDNDDEDD